MNIELAEKVRGLIRKYPERHDQTEWSSETSLNPAKHCGTSACIAGWVAAANGFTLDDLTERDTDVLTYAMKELEISDSQASALFYNFSNESALEVFDGMIESEKWKRRNQG